MTPINSIVIPDRFVAIAGEWYSGSGDLLYAVCSTGGLTTGTRCPVRDYDGREDRDRKWYLTLWAELSVDIGRAATAARDGGLSGDGYDDDADLLEEFELWVDEVWNRLVAEYGLEDWEG